MRNLLLHWRRLRNIKEVYIYGVKIRTVRGEIPRTIQSMLYKGVYESHECDLIKRSLQHTDRVLEIGAGIGLVSLVATRICGEGRVLSCEANPEMESIIRENYRLNGWQANLRMCAVTSDGREMMLFRNDNVLSSSAFDRGLAGDEVTVKSCALDDLIDAYDPSFMIMDVEGMEIELLHNSDLSRVRAIVVEMHPHIVGREEIATLVRNVEAKGFEVAEVRHKTYLLTRRDAAQGNEGRVLS